MSKFDEIKSNTSINLEAIDLAVLEDTFEGDWEMARFSLDMFKQSYPDPANFMRELANKTEIFDIQNSTHSLKGVISQIAAESSREILQKMENSAAKNKMDLWNELLQTLLPLLEKVKKEVEILRSF